MWGGAQQGYKAEEILDGISRFSFFPKMRSGLPTDELAAAARLDATRRKPGACARMARSSGRSSLDRRPHPKASCALCQGYAGFDRAKAAEEALHSRNAQLERYRFIVGSVATM